MGTWWIHTYLCVVYPSAEVWYLVMCNSVPFEVHVSMPYVLLHDTRGMNPVMDRLAQQIEHAGSCNARPRCSCSCSFLSPALHWQHWTAPNSWCVPANMHTVPCE